MTKINPKYEHGQEALNTLLVLTSEIKEITMEIYSIILYLEEKGVFD